MVTSGKIQDGGRRPKWTLRYFEHFLEIFASKISAQITKSTAVYDGIDGQK